MLKIHILLLLFVLLSVTVLAASDQLIFGSVSPAFVVHNAAGTRDDVVLACLVFRGVVNGRPF